MERLTLCYSSSRHPAPLKRSVLLNCLVTIMRASRIETTSVGSHHRQQTTKCPLIQLYYTKKKVFHHLLRFPLRDHLTTQITTDKYSYCYVIANLFLPNAPTIRNHTSYSLSEKSICKTPLRQLTEPGQTLLRQSTAPSCLYDIAPPMDFPYRPLF